MSNNSLAPFSKHFLIPLEFSSKMFAGGMQKSFFLNSNAFFAVIIVPDFSLDWMTTTQSEIALIILFLIGKCHAFVSSWGGYSLKINPFFFIIFFLSSLFWKGYLESRAVPKTAIVKPFALIVSRWIVLSIPMAHPLIVVMP